jgi:hypothetical protein
MLSILCRGKFVFKKWKTDYCIKHRKGNADLKMWIYRIYNLSHGHLELNKKAKYVEMLIYLKLGINKRRILSSISSDT